MSDGPRQLEVRIGYGARGVVCGSTPAGPVVGMESAIRMAGAVGSMGLGKGARPRPSHPGGVTTAGVQGVSRHDFGHASGAL